MFHKPRSLTESIGIEDASKLALAYDRAVSIISFGDRYFIPSRAARLDMIRAMLAAGQQYGFSEDRLTLAALACARMESPIEDRPSDMLLAAG